ncbi:hypothetical protein K432DRAFT_387550 [Lepidopterella palustris CBS 459.81]|uniref:SET domain-containing protein n=1 Tax=Lepidopterella palustris CBS 459.81 TaxID=1314670 RepID=A0A8E2DWP2_9PEZI|nr:hypothetical protein K432DRAFT_387550 [Lepidopterella palustris CBS 459.81]
MARTTRARTCFGLPLISTIPASRISTIAYNPTIQMETFHSIREIEAGEELTISYLSGTCVRDERQAQLNKWGFQCKCPACQDTTDGNNTEQQLAQIVILRQTPLANVSAPMQSYLSAAAATCNMSAGASI